MNWEYKIFRDIVHGYIEIPKPIVHLFIDTPIFQRLRNIEQTGMRVLFPSARHDRFIHSLGTYFLGVKAFAALKRNIQSSHHVNEYYSIKHRKKDNDLFWKKHEVLFHIACLMHDCAHAPFSHSLEYTYNMNGELDNQLLKIFKCKSFRTDFYYDDVNPSEHERMSAIVFKLHYSSALKRLLEDYMKIKGITSLQLNKDVEFVARAIMGVRYKTKLNSERQMLNCFISLLNSSIDVDGLDYIVRDAKLSGIDNYSVDIERLLNSVNIVEVTNLINFHFNNQYIDNVIMRSERSGENNPATFSGEFNGMVKGELQLSNFSGSMDGHAKIVGDGDFSENVETYGKNSIVTISESVYKNEPIITKPGNRSPFSLRGNVRVKFSSATTKTGSRFDGKIESSCINLSTPSLMVKGTFSGIFSGQVLGKFNGHKPNIIIGYHKSSQSVVENVLQARNYEYIWIHGHHKVAYYANYLIKELLHKATKIILSDKSVQRIFPEFAKIETADGIIEFLVSSSSYSNDTQKAGHSFFLINDNDILSLLKTVYFHNKTSASHDIEYQKLYEEFQTRIYKKSVWKSPAEFNILLSGLSHKERNSLYRRLSRTDHKSLKYGSIPSDWQEEFSIHGLEDVVWVESTLKLKIMNPDETFIIFKDAPTRLSDVTLGITNSSTESADDIYIGFYLYYDGTEINKECLQKIGTFLTTKAREYSSSM